MTMEGWFPLGCDGARLECPRPEELEQSLGKARSQAAPTHWLIALVSLTDDAERKGKPPLRVRVIRVPARKRKNDVWLVTNVLDSRALVGRIVGSILPDEVGERMFAFACTSGLCELAISVLTEH